MAASTSRAAPSMFRLKSNCSVMDVEPSELDDVISVTPAMWPNSRSSGVAMDDAMISGQPRANSNSRKVNLRKRRHRQHIEGDGPHKQDARSQQGCSYRPSDEGSG